MIYLRVRILNPQILLRKELVGTGPRGLHNFVANDGMGGGGWIKIRDRQIKWHLIVSRMLVCIKKNCIL